MSKRSTKSVRVKLDTIRDSQHEGATAFRKIKFVRSGSKRLNRLVQLGWREDAAYHNPGPVGTARSFVGNKPVRCPAVACDANRNIVRLMQRTA